MIRTTATTLAILLAVSTAAQAVELKFAPKDGLECDQEITVQRTTGLRDVEDPPPAREEWVHTVVNMKYAKAGDGYKVTGTTKSVESKRDGKVLDDPAQKSAVGRSLVIDVDANGKATDIHGYDEMIKDVLAKMPPEQQQAAAGMLKADALKNREIAEWNGRIADFAGRKVAVGDDWEVQSETPGPSGPVKFTALTRVSKIDEADGRADVTLNFSYAADGASARKAMDEVVKNLADISKSVPKISGTPVIYGGGVRVIDANTMTIDHETVTRVSTMPMEVEGAGKATMVRDETREYVYRCK